MKARRNNFFTSELESIPKLDRKHECELARRHREEGDRDAGQRVVAANLRYARQIASQFLCSGVEIEELVSASCLGFCYAIHKYDERRGTRFVTYAAEWARAFIYDHIAKSKSMVFPGRNRPIDHSIRRERAQRIAVHGDVNRANQEVAQKFDLDLSKMVQRIARFESHDVRLDKPLADDSSACNLLETLEHPQPPIDEDIIDKRRRERLAAASQAALQGLKLSVRDQDIIRRRLMQDDADADTLQTLGDSYGITRERVRQLESRIKTKLRDVLSSPEVQQHMD